MKNAAVLGAGTMGNGIAHVFAQSGYQVALFDVSEAALTRAVATIEKNLERQVAKGTLSAADKDAALARIQTGTSLEAAVSQADLVVEAATENEAIKMKIFEDLDRLAPAHCILASNTSSLSITRIAAATQRPEQVIGMHFMNPVPVMKLVEIIRGFKTSDATTDAVIRISESLGKIAISLLSAFAIVLFCGQPHLDAHDQRSH